MSTEAAPVTDKAPETPAQQPQPDPYEGLSAEERAQLEHDEAIAKSWTPAQKLAAYHYIRKGMTAEQAEKQVKADVKAEKVEDSDSDPVAKAQKKIDDLERKWAEKEQAETRKAEYERFQRDMEAEIGKYKDIASDEDAVILIRAAATTKFFETKDLRSAVKLGVDKLKSIQEKKSKDYVDQKVADRAVAGEGSGGRSAPKVEKTYGRNDLSSGKIKADVEKLIASGKL